MDKLPYTGLEQMIADARELVVPGSRWKHYKGAEYVISHVAILEATNETAVIYTSVDHPGVSFVRALGIWVETVEWKGKIIARFTKIG